jgi:SAM-dependent methyltransferase
MATTALSSFDQLAIDSAEIPQHFLDLDERVRTSPFPWRGQFSPGLIDVFLSTYGSCGTIVLDPFAGVGTTLFEAARKQLACFGTEVNPAAVAMAETVRFVALNTQQRQSLIQKARILLDHALPASLGPLFGDHNDETEVAERIAELIRQLPHGDPAHNLLTNVLIRVCEIGNPTSDDVRRALHQHAAIVESLPFSRERYAITNSDARQLPLEDGSVDLVLTSPPYINVFNYHQNSRRAMELLGWDLLHVAKSEFGSNRKHRGNRFLTVIQYCLDLEATLRELRRVIKRDGRAIFVVGRESNVLGVAFQNGSLVGALAEQCGFAVSLRQERKFKNRFGKLIYEDLIHLNPVERPTERTSGARQLAMNALALRVSSALKAEVVNGLRAAIAEAPNIRQSPIYVRPPVTLWSRTELPRR